MEDRSVSGSDTGDDYLAQHTESIAAAKETVESLESIGSYSVQLANVAHNLDLVSILEDIEEYQFAPGQSIGTYPSYKSKYRGQSSRARTAATYH
jgi:hypothetical protein